MSTAGIVKHILNSFIMLPMAPKQIYFENILPTKIFKYRPNGPIQIQITNSNPNPNTNINELESDKPTK